MPDTRPYWNLLEIAGDISRLLARLVDCPDFGFAKDSAHVALSMESRRLERANGPNSTSYALALLAEWYEEVYHATKATDEPTSPRQETRDG
jgi:hypothetical protein